MIAHVYQTDHGHGKAIPPHLNMQVRKVHRLLLTPNGNRVVLQSDWFPPVQRPEPKI